MQQSEMFPSQIAVGVFIQKSKDQYYIFTQNAALLILGYEKRS